MARLESRDFVRQCRKARNHGMTFDTWPPVRSGYTCRMYAPDPVSRFLRAIGGLTWLAVGLPEAIVFWKDPRLLSNADSLWWVVAFLVFGPALLLCGTTAKGRLASAGRVLALGIATLAPLVMIYLKPECFAGALLVIIAWQAPLLLSARRAMTWVLCQAVLLTAVLMVLYPNSLGIAQAIIFTVFQMFAYLTAHVLQRETRARHELLRTNAELKTTQLLLAQSVQISERVRISRELHDVLGHDLTALSLHLEVARNMREGLHQEIENALGIAKGLLGKVRDIVSLMRGNDQTNLAVLLRALAVDGPQLRVHLNIADNLDAADAGRAQTLVRCLQEIITNARQHSGAQNLWLDVSRQGNVVVAHAHDDGRGSVAVKFGHGLTGMRERLEEFGGSLVVRSRVNAGFALEFSLPLGASA